MHWIADRAVSDEMNCWRFVCEVLKTECDVEVPQYSDAVDVYDAVNIERELHWRPVVTPTTGDVAVFRVTATKLHIGIMVSSFQMLHYKNVYAGAVIENVADLAHARRLEGFYRYAQ